MKILATIEARMGATRLPGKVMLPLGGLPLLQRKIERVARAKTVQGVKVLSTREPMNKIIEDLCLRIGVPIYRGSEEDVTERIVEGTTEENPDIIVQLTGDNPLIDPVLIDDCVNYLIENDLDLVSNSLGQNILIGLNVRCFKRSALLKSDELCDDPKIRVHGGYYIQINPNTFKIGGNPVDPCLLRDDIRLTVDEPNDYELVRRVFETLNETKPAFGSSDILALIDENPEWKDINSSVKQKRPGDG